MQITKFKKPVRVFLMVALLLAAFVIVFNDNKSVLNCSGSNVVIIKAEGDFVTYDNGYNKDIKMADSSKIVEYINEASLNRSIKVIILSIDSLGGSPVAGEEIADALRKANKETIALIRGYGDSAAYMAATGAKKIYASEFSEIGNIGITMSYLDYSLQNASEGIQFQQLSSGQFKDITNPNKELTEAERYELMQYVNKLHESFVDFVSLNRNIDKTKVELIADGSIFNAKEAKTRGLIDEIGGMNEINDYLKNSLKIKPNACFSE